MADAVPILPSRYRVLSTLGQGGMATVYLAEDSLAHTQVALKVLFPHLRQDAVVAERFRREIAAVRRIGHRSIVAIHDLVDTPDVLCLVLEYHPGADLKRTLRLHGPLPVDQVVSLGLQVLEGLHAAHLHGVVHRDIKPHNILVDEQGTAKITDFGLARVDDLVGVTTHTMTLGTPEYLAPEQLSSPVVDGRADLYALGVTLFEALTGTLPFKASSPMALMRMHQEAAVPNPCTLRPEVPGWLGQLVQRAMAKDPDERFPTAEAMRLALQEQRSGRNAMAIPDAGKCRVCGAALVSGLPACVECGRVPVVLRTLPRGGTRVYIHRTRPWWKLGRRALGDDLTFDQKRRLRDELRVLGATLPGSEDHLDERLRSLPLVAAERLSQADANRLVDLLEHAGLPAQVSTLGAAEYVWNCLRMNQALVAAFLGLLAGFFALVALLNGPWKRPDWTPVLLIIGPALGMVGSMTQDLLKNGKPLAHFTGQAGSGEAADALTSELMAGFRKLRSPRLRAMVRSLVARGLGLRAVLAPEYHPQVRQDVERLLRAVLTTAARAQALEQVLETVDVAAVVEQLKVLEEHIRAETHAADAEELIQRKAELTQQLADLDGHQQEMVQQFSKLLDASTRLSAMSAEVGNTVAGDAQSVASLSTILTQLNEELEAHQEVRA